MQDRELTSDHLTAFLESDTDAYAILQLRRGPDTLDERFESFERLQRQGKQPNMDHYEVIYHGNLPSTPVTPEAVMVQLEALYTQFNTPARPEDFTGHSLSVSDIVALKVGGVISCHYVDDIGFRELPLFDMEGCRRDPVKFQWTPIDPAHTGLLYTDPKNDAEYGCIGHLRGHFGSGGDEFRTTWFSHTDDARTAPFCRELDAVVSALREKGGLLEDRTSMEKACYAMHGTPVSNWVPTFGFQMETERRRYCLRCTPARGDYNFYLYCYDKSRAREQTGQRDSVLGRLQEARSDPVSPPKKGTKEMEL